MKINHITPNTLKTENALETLAVAGPSPNTPSPRDIEENMSPLDHPRYKENPIYLFLECYIEDIIGQLPDAKFNALQNMNLKKVFKTKATDWKAVIRETLLLSDTIDIAIEDNWYRHRKHFLDAVTGQPDPFWFSRVFTDKLMTVGSNLDVWPPGALIAAKRRICHAKGRDTA